jgi:hypothetical protein
MMNGSRRIKRDRGEEVSSGIARERVVRKDGKVVNVAAEHVDRIKDKNGIRPTGRGGRSASLYFSMAEAAERYVRGPDGLDFVWNDGWEPAPLFSKGAKTPQRDPDGNVWVKTDGEWVLESEVE